MGQLVAVPATEGVMAIGSDRGSVDCHTVASVVRLFSRRLGGAVLCFHGLRRPGNLNQSTLHVEPALLDQLLDVCRTVAEVVPLRDLLHRLRDGKPTAGQVALTFDDAYASLLPGCGSRLLDTMPRTLFVVSHCDGPFWWDRLEAVTARASPAEWRRFATQVGLPTPLIEASSFDLMRRWVLSRCRGVLPPQMKPHLIALEQALEVVTGVQRPMTHAELEALGRDPLVDLAVHTAHHPVLPLLNDAEIEAEVNDCFELLRDVVPDPLPVLAAPYGLLDERTVRLARDAGMAATMSIEPRTIGGRSTHDPIPRFSVGARERPWKLGLKLAGVTNMLHPSGVRYSRLPSWPS